MKKLLVLTAVAMLVLGTMGCRSLDWCRRGEACVPMGVGCAEPCATGCAPVCGDACGAAAPLVPAANGYTPTPMQP